jgi:hypothetical protein
MLLPVFLATMEVSLFHGPKTIAPRLQSPVMSPWHRRLSGCHEVPRFPFEEYLARPGNSKLEEDEEAVEQMVHLQYTVTMTITP